MRDYRINNISGIWEVVIGKQYVLVIFLHHRLSVYSLHVRILWYTVYLKSEAGPAPLYPVNITWRCTYVYTTIKWWISVAAARLQSRRLKVENLFISQQLYISHLYVYFISKKQLIYNKTFEIKCKLLLWMSPEGETINDITIFILFLYYNIYLFYFYSVNHCGLLLLLVAGQKSHSTRIVQTHHRHNKCNKHITARCYI